MACCVGWASSSCSAPYQLSSDHSDKDSGGFWGQAGALQSGGADKSPWVLVLAPLLSPCETLSKALSSLDLSSLSQQSLVVALCSLPKDCNQQLNIHYWWGGGSWSLWRATSICSAPLTSVSFSF